MNGESDRIQDFFIIEGQLGQGSFGEVRKATRKSDKQQFAVKIFNKNELSDDEMNSLENEIEILTKIDHPNVVKLYEVFEDEQYFYMVMEMMQGGELFERIIEKDHYTEQEAAETIRPIIDALRYCHSMDIVHRDLKPENLLYSTKDKGAIIKISDFGLARFMNNEMMTTQCGTPNYLAPEIIMGIAYDKSIDFWSVGIILYIMLSGNPPFYNDNEEQLYQEICEGKLEFPSDQWNMISNEAQDLIKKLLVVDPKKRLVADQIMKHPWINNNIYNQELTHIPEQIDFYRRKSKMKKLSNVVKAVSRLRHIKNLN